MLHQKTSIKVGIVMLCALLMSAGAFGQIFKPDLLSPAGKTSKTSKIAVTWSIGKIAIVPVNNSVASSAVVMSLANIEAQVVPHTVSNLTIYPNPSSDWITVPFNFDELTAIDLTISDVKGNLVRKMQLTVQKEVFELNISQLTAGNYWITVTDKNQNVLHYSKISKI